MSTGMAAGLGILATALGIINIIIGLVRNKGKDDKAEQSEMTTVIVKLENISTQLVEIKADNKTIREEMQRQNEKLVRLDESLKSAWNAINKMQDGK